MKSGSQLIENCRNYLLFAISLLVIIMTSSCRSNDVKFIEELKKLSIQPKSIQVQVNSNSIDSVIFEESSYIFDSVFLSHKVDLIGHLYYSNFPHDKNSEVYVALKNLDFEYSRKLREEDRKSILSRYQNPQLIEVESYIHGNFNAEEYWNLGMALESLIGRSDKFVEADYFSYVRSAANGENASCQKLKILHLLVNEVKLEDFWKDTDVRKDASKLTRKYNDMAEMMGCEQIDENDHFKKELDKLEGK